MTPPAPRRISRPSLAPLALAALVTVMLLAAPLAVATTVDLTVEPPVNKAASAQAADAIVSLLYENKPQAKGSDGEQDGSSKAAVVPRAAGASGACSPTGRRPGPDALVWCQPDDGNRIDVFYQPGVPGDVPRLDIEQVGTGHTATIHFEGSTLSAVVRQEGSNHDALIRQSGARLAAVSLQLGSGHEAELRQEGSDLRSHVRQDGDGHASSVRQQGSGLSVDVIQEGSGHSSTVVQQGSGNAASVRQISAAATGRR